MKNIFAPIWLLSFAFSAQAGSFAAKKEERMELQSQLDRESETNESCKIDIDLWKAYCLKPIDEEAFRNLVKEVEEKNLCSFRDEEDIVVFLEQEHWQKLKEMATKQFTAGELLELVKIYSLPTEDYEQPFNLISTLKYRTNWRFDFEKIFNALVDDAEIRDLAIGSFKEIEFSSAHQIEQFNFSRANGLCMVL